MREEEIINATRHPINILDDNGVLVKIFPKSNIQIRLDEQIVRTQDIAGIPIGNIDWEASRSIPEIVEGRYYIVSQLTQHALAHRSDLLVPKGIVRDTEGNILGCRMFSKFAS